MTRRERATYRLLMTLGVVSLLVFYGWWLRPSQLPDNGDGALWRVVDVVLFAALTFVLSHRVFMDVYVWVVARKIRRLSAAPAPAPGLRVAFITTFVPGAEGLDLLGRTLPAMLAADYPHDVWLLDEGGDPEARELAEALGVHYFTRHGRREYQLMAGPFTRRTKGGNHNSWYDNHAGEYDVVAQIDTDFIPRHDFLTQTLGHFRDPTVAWVVTPQIYGNTDSFVTRGAAQQQYTFYGPVLRGLAGRGMANMLGANHVVRVAALQEIGLYAGHITEDLLTGMRLHARGWRSEYVPLPLAVGEGPDTWKAYLAQQQRWAYGCIDVLGKHARDLVKPMPVSWRALYLSLMQGYFSGLAGALGCALLVVYFVGGLDLSRLQWQELLIFGAPLFLFRQVIRLWMNRFTVRPDVEGGFRVAGAVVSIAAWPIYLAALVKVLRQQPLTFHVTPKGRVRKSRGSARRLFRPHLAWAASSVLGLGAMVAFDRWSPVLAAWAVVNTLSMGGLWLAADRTEKKVSRTRRTRRAKPRVHVVTRPRVPAIAARQALLVDAHVVDHV